MNRFLFLLILFALLQTAKSQSAESDTVWSKSIGSEVKAVKFSPDGQFIYAAAIGRKPMKLSTETGEILQEYEQFKYEADLHFSALDISSDGKWLIGGEYGNNIYIIDTETGETVKTLKTEYEENQSNKFNTVAITTDNRYVIAINRFGLDSQTPMNAIVIWDAVTGELKKTINSRWAMKVAISPINNYFGVSYFWYGLDEKGAIELYDLKTFEKIQTLGYHEKEIYDIAFSPDGSLLASGGWDGVIKIWDVEQKKLLKEFIHLGIYNNVSWINKNHFASTSDHTLKLWSINNPIELANFNVGSCSSIDVRFDGKYIVLGVLPYQSVRIIKIDDVVNVKQPSSSIVDNTSPNPTNNISNISFILSNSGLTSITITDANGSEIEVLHNGFLELGEHKFQWIPKSVSSGIFFCNISGKNFSKTLKIILEK